MHRTRGLVDDTVPPCRPPLSRRMGGNGWCLARVVRARSRLTSLRYRRTMKHTLAAFVLVWVGGSSGCGDSCDAPDKPEYSCQPVAPGTPGSCSGPMFDGTTYDQDMAFPMGCEVRLPTCVEAFPITCRPARATHPEPSTRGAVRSKDPITGGVDARAPCPRRPPARRSPCRRHWHRARSPEAPVCLPRRRGWSPSRSPSPSPSRRRRRAR